MLARLRIGPKLLLAPGVVLVLLVLLCCGSYTTMVRQNESLDSIVQRQALHLRSAAELAVAARGAHAQAYQVLTWMGGGFPRARLDPLALDLQAQQGAVERGLARLSRQTADTPDEQRHVEEARAAWALYVPAVRDVIEIARLDPSTSANAMIKAERAFGTVAQRLAELARREQALCEQASSQAAQDMRLVAILMPVAIAFALCAALAITMAVRRALLADIGAIGAAASGLASGDLTIRARSDGADEIAQTARALDAGIRGLNGQLRTVLDSARTIGAASRDITLGRSSLPPRAQLHAAAEGVTATLHALAAALGDDAAGACSVEALAARADAFADAGSASVHRLVTTIAQVRQAAARLEYIGAELEDTLGCAGAGTAAVADTRALQAAREARTLAQATVALLDGGRAGALDAGAALGHLAESMDAATGIAVGMKQASAERARAAASAAQAIMRMDELTQQGSRMVEEAALAARTLQQQALNLARTVAAFRLDEAVRGNEGGADETALPGAVLHRPGRAGHPYLRLASSRGKAARAPVDYS
jgi:methyl-accepting chemotaxis protein